MLYNGVELPDIETVWTDKETYPYTVIKQDSESGVYVLYFASDRPYVEYSSVYGYYFLYLSNFGNAYKLTNGIWEFYSSSVVSVGLRTGIVWTNTDILDTDGVVYSAVSDPVDPNAPTGTIQIESSQILDDSASFVIYISDVDFTSAEYTLKYIVYSGGEEIKSNVSEVITDDTEGFHLTSPNLTPETEYEIQFILQKDGVDTSVTASTTFTTLAGSGAGEGETPDYSGQLENIQQSVDNVGTKLDGVQETLTETKEEITSLPQKIATSITEGVKGLFIPSQEDLTAIRDKYEDMLSEKLGFVWQAYDLLTGFVGDLQTNLESGEAYEFTFPGVKLPMQGEEFVLVAETPVSLENDLMDVLRPVLGTIVSIICVSAFVNMAHDYVLAIISGVSAYQFERRKD